MSDESLFREIEEEVRQDQFKSLWNRYGTMISALVIALVAGVGGYEGYKYYQQSQAEAAGLVFSEAVKKAAVKDAKSEDVIAALKAVPPSTGYGQLAALSQAGVLAKDGKTAEAVAAYEAIANSAANDLVLRDAARIKAAYLLVDTETPDQLIARVGTFDKPDHVWRHQAREIFGMAAWRTGDFTMAQRYMDAIVQDAATPAGMRQRAQAMLQMIAPKLSK
jgi:hypothetical protein